MHQQPQISLQVLGPVGFAGPGSEEAMSLLRQPKRVAVFAYLLLHPEGGWVTREEIISVFWPQSPEERARNALRQSLAFIKGALGRNVLQAQGRTALRVSRARVTCDAPRFVSLLEGGRAEEALALYRGEFLEDMEIPDSPAWTEWLSNQRSLYRSRASGAAWTMARASEGGGRPRSAAFWGKKALDLSLFNEADARRLIKLLARLGDYPEALRTYRGLQGYLRSHGDTDPSPETSRLMEEIRTGTANGNGTHHGPCRRVGTDRRQLSDRRQVVLAWRLPERRVSTRRKGERRSGEDRREQGLS